MAVPMKEREEKLVARMREWQRLEDATIAHTAKLRTKTEHPLVRLVMEIIQRDSAMHYRVQQFIKDTVQEQRVDMSHDDLSEVWDSIQQHIAMEQKTVELGIASLKDLKGSRNVVQQYLLSYLLADEQKHEKLLNDLELIKKGMYET